ncbi:hypothetical protein [Streptomyces sp. NPDC047928]|uniref:hypothetical protein n=1 Tax=unclassified Streptomyces TaxID=2593676 RepID=UPI00371DE07B
MNRRRGGRAGRVATAATAAMCVMAAGPAQQAWAAGEPAPYAFPDGVKTVKGATTTSDAPSLTAGTPYRDSIEKDEKLVYRVDLDADTHAYVSAVAIPKAGTKVAYADELKVTLQDRDGSDCDSSTTRFGTAEFARPMAAYAHRTLKEGRSLCQKAGTYYVVVQRTSKDGSSPGPWDLEIRHVLEPGLKTAGPTAAPRDWPSRSPEAAQGGAPRERAGGSSFFDAPGLTDGEWTDRIEPGQSRFYRVPVDWGQQLFVSADIGSASGSGFVAGALPVSLYNPALGLVDSADSLFYDGKQKSTSLDPLPPVAYENRFDSDSSVENTRFAGWYYLRVSLNPQVGEKFGEKAYGLTLRIHVRGTPEAAPPYAGPAGIFAVTQDDKDAAASGQSGPQAGRGDTMRLVGVAGIGTGTVLVLGLGAWTLLGRRRAAAAATAAAGQPGRPEQSAGSAQSSGYGPPAAW